MSVIVRLQNLPWAANAVDIRHYFHGLSIPEGGVHIVGGESGDAFIAFSTDEDARQAMLRDGGKIKEIAIKLYLSSRTEMQKIIDQARQQSISMQQFMPMPAIQPLPVPVANIGVPNIAVSPVAIPNVQGLQVPLQNVQNVGAMVSSIGKQDGGASARPVNAVPDQTDNRSVAGSVQSVKSDLEKDKKDKRRRRSRSVSNGSSNSRSDSRSRSRSSSRSRDHRSNRDRHYDRRRKRSRSRDRRRRRDRSRSRELRERDRMGRDRRRDYNRPPREEFDENYPQPHRWNNPNQRNNRFGSNKPRSDFHKGEPHAQTQHPQNKSNYQQQKDKSSDVGKPVVALEENADSQSSLPQSSSSGQVGVSTTLPKPPEFKGMPTPSSIPGAPHTIPPPNSIPNASQNIPPQNSVPNAPHSVPPQNSIPNTPHTLPPETLPPTTSVTPHSIVPQTSAPNIPLQDPVLIASQSIPPQAPNAQPIIPPNPQNFYGNYLPPMFNQGMNFMGGMMPFGGFPPVPHMQMGAMQPDRSIMQPAPKDFVGNDSRKSPMRHLNNEAGDLPQDVGKKPRVDDASLPNDKRQGSRGDFNWGYDNQFPYRKKEQKPDAGYPKPYQQPEYNRNNKNNSNTLNRRANNNNTCVQIKNVPENVNHKDIAGFFRNIQIPFGAIKIVVDEHGNKSGEVFVKFNHISDKNKAICRSGCLLNNAIVTVLHVDDTEFDSATDVDEFNKQYWTPDNEDANSIEMTDVDKGVMKEIKNNSLKISGNVRFHPLNDNRQKIRLHIRSICEQYKPNDMCLVRLKPNRLHAFFKFDNDMTAQAAVQFLEKTTADGHRINVSICSEDEFIEAKRVAMFIDVQQFLKNATSGGTNPQDGKADPRIQVTHSGNKRQLLKDPVVNEGNLLLNENDMKNNDGDGELRRSSNKVLLPTPSVPQQIPVPSTNCIVMNRLPPQANDKDILHFFSDVGVIPTQIHIMLDSDGNHSGEAYCEFENNEDALTASSKNNFELRNCLVGVQPVLRDEMLNAIGYLVETGPHGLAGPSPQQGPISLPPNAPQGGPPSLFANAIRMEYKGGAGKPDWNPPHHSNMGQHSPNFGNMYGRGERFDRGFERGYRGGRGRGRGGDGEFGGWAGRGRNDPMGRGRGSADAYRGGGGDNNSYRGGREGGRVPFRGGRRGGGPGHMDNYERRDRNPNEFLRNQSSENLDIPKSKNPEKPSIGSITRPIQLEADSVREFGLPGCVVSAENVPFRAELEDILQFFQNFDLPAESIIRRYNDAGHVTGDARIAFKTPADAKRAIKYLNNNLLLNRRIILNLFK